MRKIITIPVIFNLLIILHLPAFSVEAVKGILVSPAIYESLSRVTVLDKENNILQVFENKEDVIEFGELWEDRCLEPNFNLLEDWDYQIDVMTRTKSTRWLYDSKTGLCSVSGNYSSPVYSVRYFDELNDLLAEYPAVTTIRIIETTPVFYWTNYWYFGNWHYRDRHYHSYYKHRRRPHKRSHYYHDDDRLKKRDSDSIEIERHEKYRVKEEYSDEENRNRFSRERLVPERKKEIVKNPIDRSKIDERKLPGIFGIVEDK